MNQKEFENLIEQVIERKITRKEISSKYHIAPRTINKKITQLAKTNPNLYERFISIYPFQPKEITHIDFTQLTKSIIKNDEQLNKLVDTYDISARTFNRKINKMKNSQTIDNLTGLTENDIYEMYIRYRKSELTFEDHKFIQTMKIGNIKIQDERSQNRENYLQELLNNYYEIISKEGISKAKAAKRLGFSYTDMCKKEDELERIKTQKQAKQNKDNFHNSIKTTNIPKINAENQSIKSKLIVEKEVEGEEK